MIFARCRSYSSRVILPLDRSSSSLASLADGPAERL